MTLQYAVWRDASEVAQGPVLNENVIAVGATTTTSPTTVDPAAVSSRETRRVRLMSTVDAWVTWGNSPTALNTGLGGRMLGAENPEYFDMEAGYSIAVIER